MMVMVAPPVAMTPATAMNFYDIGRISIVDCGALPRKRTRSLRGRKQQCGSDADSSESFIHSIALFSFRLAACQHSARSKVPLAQVGGATGYQRVQKS